MARPAMRDPSGRWSLTQVAAAAEITRQTARTLVAAHYLDAGNLGYKDVPLAKVAAALLDAPRPVGLSRQDTADAVTKRNFEALALARRVIEDPSPAKDATMVVTSDQVTLYDDPFALMGHLRGLTVTATLLPIGAWATAATTLREQASR